MELNAVQRATMIDPWFLRELQSLASDGDGTDGLTRTYRAVDNLRAEFEAEDALLLQRPREAGTSRRLLRFASGGAGGGFRRSGPMTLDQRSGEAIAPRSSSSAPGPNRIGPGNRVRLLLPARRADVLASPVATRDDQLQPETVSTDYDTSDRLYFEPLTEEDVLA